MLTTVIEGIVQNGTVEGVNVTHHLRQLETRNIRITIEEVDPQETTSEDQKESSV
jgi:hypothetical protein